MVVYTSLGSIVACVMGVLIGSDVLSMRFTGWILISANLLGALSCVLSLLPYRHKLKHSSENKSRTFCEEIHSFANVFRRGSLFRTVFLIWSLVSVAQYVPLFLIEDDLKRSSWKARYVIFSIFLTDSKETSTSICTLLSLLFSFLSAAFTGYILDANESYLNKLVMMGTSFGVLSLGIYGLADLTSSFELILLGSVFCGVAQGVAGTALWSKTVNVLRVNDEKKLSHQEYLLSVTGEDEKCEEEYGKDENFSRDMSIFWLATILPQILIPPLRSFLFYVFNSNKKIAFAVTWFSSAFIVCAALVPIHRHVH